jgi:nucleotide-binding universal stress UspA family protein
MYTSIVVPQDGSAFSGRALPVALAIARRSDAAVHLVHVHEFAGHRPGSPGDTSSNVAADEMRVRLMAAAAQLRVETGLCIDARFLDGPVVPTLVRYLASRRHDLVVMMTRGRGLPGRIRQGSVVDGLIGHASVPLLLVRPGAEWPAHVVEPLFRHVLIPLDGSVIATTALDHVASLCTPAETIYTLLTVLDPAPLVQHSFPNAGGLTEDQARAPLRASAEAHLSSAATELRDSGAEVRTRVATHRSPAESILAVADELAVDLIALSTHGHGGRSRLLLGSVVDEVVRRAAVPLLITAAENPDEDASSGKPTPTHLPEELSATGAL